MTSVKMTEFVPSYKAKGKSPGYGTFRQFMVSDQMRKPLIRAAWDVIALAKADPNAARSADPRDGHYNDAFAVNSAPMETRMGTRRNPRVMVLVTNDHKNATAVEFGSGPPATGPSKGGEREQGGWSPPKRVLGRAGAKVGRLHEGRTGAKVGRLP